MPKLIIIRGNSGSGKTTLAKTLQHKFGRNTMVISQDVVRREMLWVQDKPANEAVYLMIDLLNYGSKHCEIVILEGILYSDIYKPLFEAAAEIFKDNIYAYYYDIPFEETVKRHATKTNKFSFGENEMRRWWRDKDYIGFIKEKNITSDFSIDETICRICNEVLND
ncbi:MAG: kinase [Eubacterium sp.]|nr:kinase [Eubacterium sp.]